MTGLSEFELIQRFLSGQVYERADVALGIGDDCALLRPPEGCELAVSMDTLVDGIHFDDQLSAEDIGYKSLAVSLSDLAAMGASPAWATLALTLPHVDASWVQGFCRGFLSLAEAYKVQLVGGDVSRGPMTITVQAHGFVPTGRALCRGGAQPGDLVYVSGTLGDAALERRDRTSSTEGSARQHLRRPQPRVDLGQKLRGIASAAIDISDGLLADLGHVLDSSGVGAQVDLARVPLSAAVRAALESNATWEDIVAGGDDYELCFTVPPEAVASAEAIGADCSCTRIGEIQLATGLVCVNETGEPVVFERQGFEHFAD